MNIIDLLTADHLKMRSELEGIRRSLSQEDLRQKIKLFISKYELHESIEEEILFPVLHSLPESGDVGKILPSYEKAHERVWLLLDQIVDLMGHSQFAELQQAFQKFHAAVDSHLGHEERSLFPVVRGVVPEKTLDDLGKQAEKKFSRFAGL